MKRSIEELELFIARTKHIKRKIDAQYELVAYISTSDNKRKTELGEQIISASEENNYKEGIIKGLLVIASCYGEASLYNEGLIHCKRALVLCVEIENPLFHAKVLNTISLFNVLLGKYDEALENIVQARVLAIQSQDSLTEAYTLEKQGIVWNVIGDFEQAVECFLKSKSIFELINHVELTGSVMINLASSYYRLGDYSTALEYHLRGGDIILAGKNYNQISEYYNNLGLYYSEQQQYDKADEAYLTGIEYAQKNEHTISIAFAYSNLGTSCNEQGNYNAALNFFLKALEQCDKIGENYLSSTVYLHLGEVNTALEFYDEALKYYEQARSIAEQKGSKIDCIDVWYHLGQYYKKTGDISIAIQFFNRALSTAVECQSVRFQILLNDALAQCCRLTAEPEKALFHYEQKKEIEDLQSSHHHNAKLNRMLLKESIKKYEQEQETLLIETKKLHNEIERKNQELQSLALQITQSRTALNSINKESKTNVGDGKSKSNNHVLSIITNENQWSVFNKQFSVIHPTFSARLAEKYPILSPTEIKICSLLKINLTTQNIADILITSKRTIDTHRYNIRKKIGVGSFSSLSNILNSIR